MCGAIATAAMIAISMRLNFLFGYSLGQTPEKALVFGAISAIADAWKGLAPVFIVGLARARRWGSALAAGIVWAACFLYSVSSAIGIAVQDRAALTGGRETLPAAYKIVRSELAAQETQRKTLAKVRSSGEIEAGIAAILARPIIGGDRVRGTVATISSSCARTDARTAEACAEVAILRQELASAIEAARLDDRLSALRRQAAELRDRGAILSTDPQAEFFSRVTWGRMSVRAVGLGLVVLLAIVVELVSAFGLAVIVAYVDATRDRQENESAVAGTAIDYMAERIEPGEASVIDVDALFADYKRWCVQRSRKPLARAGFISAFDRSRVECGLESIEKFGSVYQGVRLVSP